MKTLEIIGYKRANLGKSESKKLREESNVPCVIYGGDEQVHFCSNRSRFTEAGTLRNSALMIIFYIGSGILLLYLIFSLFLTYLVQQIPRHSGYFVRTFSRCSRRHHRRRKKSG